MRKTITLIIAMVLSISVVSALDYQINEYIYEKVTYETSNQNISLNVSFNDDIYTGISAYLYYGTQRYSTTEVSGGNNSIFSTNLDIPLTSDLTQQNISTEYYNTTESLYMEIGSAQINFGVGQTFNASEDYNVTGFLYKNYGNNPNFVYLQTLNSSGTPNGTLEQGTTTYDIGNDWYMSVLDNPTTIYKGKQYAFTLSRTNVPPTNVSYHTDQYSKGTMVVQNRTNSIWSTMPNDMLFEVVALGYSGNVKWELSLTNSTGNYYENTTAITQLINEIYFYQCTLGTKYLNLSFKNETNTANLEAYLTADDEYWLGSGTVKKETSYVSSSPNLSYSFCFNPSSKTVNIDLSLYYYVDDYPQRNTILDTSYTSTITQKILYLLNSNKGIYSTMVIQDGYNNVVSGATITVEREIDGVLTIVGSATTDSAGSATFFVNPNFNHRYTVTKTGYQSQTVTITPTQSVYTLTLSASLVAQNYTYKGINYVTYPAPGGLAPFTNYIFGFNITTSQENIESCLIEIRNSTFDILGNQSGCSTGGGNVSITINTANYSKLFGYYYLDLGDGLELIKANDAWYVENVSLGGSGVWDLLISLRDLPDWGDTPNRQEFSRLVFFFFGFTLILGFLTYFTGYDFSQPGPALLIVWGTITIFSIAGYFELTGITPYSFLDKYTIMIISSFITFGYLINYWRRVS